VVEDVVTTGGSTVAAIEALKEAGHAIELDPAEPQAWVLYGSALDGLGRHQEALESFRRAHSLNEKPSFISFKISELLFASKRWREGAAHLDDTLAQFAHCEHPSAGDTKSLVHRVLPNVCDPKICRLLIKVLLLVYRKHRILSALAKGLIECIPDIMSSSLTDADASTWRDCWQMAQSLPEFRLSLRLLDSAGNYRKTHDLSVLMDLPQEERTLLENLIGVHIEAIA